MNTVAKGWIWFVLLMVVFVGAGIFVGQNRRADLGKAFEYSLEEFRQVDPALVNYHELEPLEITIANPRALALARGFVCVGGEQAVEILGDKIIQVEGLVGALVSNEKGELVAGVQDQLLVLTKQGGTRGYDIPSENAFVTSVAVDERFIYGADAGSRLIWKFDRSGEVAPVKIGIKNEAKGIIGFSVPSPFFDLALSPSDGSLWAVNPGHHAFENYRADGTLISRWAASGMHVEGFSGCCNPTHIAILPDGGFVTSEKGLARVKVHNADGSFRCVVAAPDLFDEGVVGLDLAADAIGRIYVLDPSRNQVRVFEEIK